MKRFALAALACTVALSARAANFTVTNLDDAGPGSLRDAVAQANANPGADLITFNVNGAIVLTSGQITITEALTINGPGASSLSISGNDNSRVFAVTDAQEQPCPATTGPNDFVVSMRGLTLTKGRRTASNAGGALVSTKSLALLDVVISASTARRGGGLAFLTQYPGQSLNLQNVQVLFNLAAARPGIKEDATGGGVYVSPLCGTAVPATRTTVDIVSSIVADNAVMASDTFQAYAGGLFLNVPAEGSTVQILDSRIVGNTVVLPATLGSTTYNAGGIGASVRSMLIQGSEIAGNRANFGAGIEFYNVDAASQNVGSQMSLNLVNSTVSGNTAYAAGGGIQLVSNVDANFVNATLAANNSQPGRSGAMRIVSNTGQASPTLLLVSTIVADSPSGVDIGAGGTVPVPYTVPANQSLIGAPDSSTTISGDKTLIGVNPLLGPLAYNGGTTRTQALLPGSPAIDAGSNPMKLATDQRGAGYPRTNDGLTDMGAYESATAPPIPVNNQPIPTLSEYALMLLALLLAGIGSMAMRRRS